MIYVDSIVECKEFKQQHTGNDEPSILKTLPRRNHATLSWTKQKNNNCQSKSI